MEIWPPHRTVTKQLSPLKAAARTGPVCAEGCQAVSEDVCQNFCQGAYPVREAQGMIFAYMGPPEAIPEFPVFDTYSHPAGNRLANFKMFYPCNWLQVVENAADPIHNEDREAMAAARVRRLVSSSW